MTHSRSRKDTDEMKELPDKTSAHALVPESIPCQEQRRGKRKAFQSHPRC